MKTHHVKAKDQSGTFFGQSRWLLYTCVLLIFALGIGFRILDITNPPLGEHSWKVLSSASYTRGLYYQMLPTADPILLQKAVALMPWHDEPPITEGLVALSYLLVGGEHLWIYRIWTMLFWVIGGMGLFTLVRRMTSVDGAVVALGYYMLLPFGNSTTRAFLSEPLMIMWIILALYAIYRWVEKPNWKWAILAGVLCGLAVLTKVFAVFPLAPAFILVVLTAYGFRRTITNPQFWAIVVLAGVIPSAFYIFPQFGLGSDYISTWVLPYTRRLLDISFYIEWLHQLNGNFNLAIVLTAIVSVSILEKRWRAMCIGLWIGYLLLGATVPELIYSHIYYSLPLVAIIAISLGPVSSSFLGKLRDQGRIWHILAIGACLVAVGYSVFMSRKYVVAVDYHQKAQQWEELGQNLPPGSVIGLLDDYGSPLIYYGWKKISWYPYSWDQDMGAMAGHDRLDLTTVDDENLPYFQSHIDGYQFFLVTSFDELDAQPYLKQLLYENYPIYEQRDWYIIFDLRNPN
jgi:4-amino-4-deoxy-L-arabinose transferase-like glycosyltransferase